MYMTLCSGVPVAVKPGPWVCLHRLLECGAIGVGQHQRRLARRRASALAVPLPTVLPGLVLGLVSGVNFSDGPQEAAKSSAVRRSVMPLGRRRATAPVEVALAGAAAEDWSMPDVAWLEDRLPTGCRWAPAASPRTSLATPPAASRDVW